MLSRAWKSLGLRAVVGCLIIVSARAALAKSGVGDFGLPESSHHKPTGMAGVIDGWSNFATGGCCWGW
ncbi:MAG: hypothetical protein ABUL67_00140 [Haliangium ochraceum]